jgi:hypothetical protein
MTGSGCGGDVRLSRPAALTVRRLLSPIKSIRDSLYEI